MYRLRPLFLLCSLLLFLSARYPLAAENILILHSYQEGPSWVKNITDGMLSVFQRSPEFDYEFHFEYMNVLDADPSLYPQVFRLRLGGTRFDLVLTADNQALEFVVANRKSLFAGVPIVFCSVDDFSAATLKGERNITGVVGEQDFASTIALALRLHPETRQLIILANRKVIAESAAYKRIGRWIREEFASELNVRFWEDPKLSEVLQRAPNMSPGTVVLAMSFFTDDSGRPLPLPASARQAAEALKVPMYSCWESLLGNGIVGGMITGGFQQGEAAALLGLRILKGESAGAIPVQLESPNRYMFDYAQLQRFRIPERNLPKGSLVLDKPESFFHRYRDLFWIGSAVATVLALLLALSWIYALRQRRLQRSIRQSEERLASALEATGSGIWEWDPQTGRTLFDPTWFSMLGYEPETFPQIYETWANLLHPDDRSATEEAVRRHVADASDFTLEFRMRARDGSWRWISSSGKIVEKDAHGKAARLVGTHVDVTERKEAEEAVQESARSYQFLYEKSPSISLILDMEGRIQDVNSSFVSSLGYTKEEVLGRVALELVAPQHRDRAAAQLAKDLAGIPTPQLDVDVLARDGSTRTILFSESAAVLFAGEQPRGVLITGMDITERKRAMEQARLQQQQLIHADKMASLGVLVSGVAHEINNPNNYILLNGRICSKVWMDMQPILRQYFENHGDFLVAGMPFSEAQPKIGQLIAGIAEGAQRIKKIVQNLRDFARKDTGDLTQPMDINHVVDSAISLLQNLIDKSTNHLVVECGKGLPMLRGNFQQVEQVLINLITNACHALSNRDKGITIKTGYDDRSGHIRVEIRDEGIGIPEEHLMRITDPFFTTKQDIGGTGLGLSISYNILKNHGGDLAIASTAGQGTTVTVQLPVRSEERP